MKEYRFDITRFNPDTDQRPYTQTFSLKVKPGWSVLDCLNEIRWRIDGTLSFCRSCRSGICGSCAMTINGKNRLACETAIGELRKKTIIIQPLHGFPILKDLAVDFDPFFKGIAAVKPFLLPAAEPEGERERLQSRDERAKLDGLYECILCGACTSSCPSFWHDETCLGPAALLKAHRYCADSRDNGTAARCRLIDATPGVWQCHTAFNCVEACPKGLNPAASIQALQRECIRHNLFSKNEQP